MPQAPPLTPEVRPGLPRSFDVALALVALVLLAPLLVVLAVVVLLASGRPILHRQSRVGRFGRAFTMYKFRTMREDASLPGVTVSGDRRVTPLGRHLRRAKLDELPELVNVLLGDLALVGPRPEVPRYVDWEQPLWRELLRSRPGLTDPVTLALKDEESLLRRDGGDDPERYYRETLLPRKLRASLAYARGRSARSDCVVLLLTLGSVVCGRLNRRRPRP